MPSQVEVVNMALLGSGAVRIESMDEDEENARRMTIAWPICLKSMLRSHPWSFAKKEAVLSQLAETPILSDDATYIYTLPVDFIKLLKTDTQGSYAYKIKGKNLYTNVETVKIEYIFYNEDPDTWDDSFVTAVAARLKAETWFAITSDKKLVKTNWDEYVGKWNYAKSMNGQEVTPDESINDEWINSRYGGQGGVSNLSTTGHPLQ